MTTKYNLDHNLDVLVAMASNLTPYLYEDELFGQINNNYPKLTVGGLLMRLHELRYLLGEMTDKQQARFREAEAQWQAKRAEWKTHYEQKILKEMNSRLGAIDWYLDDASKDARSVNGGWRNEMEKRTIVAHLANEAKSLNILNTDISDHMLEVDNRLRRYYQEGAFMWDSRLEGAYPKHNFWWLYGDARDLE